MNGTEDRKISRGRIAVRLLYSLVCLIILEILKFVVQVTVIFQFIYLLITQKYSDPLRGFSNKVAAYVYRIIRYTTLNENRKVFPFNEFPPELEKPEDHVDFD